MEKEAENVAMQELNKYYVKCGDIYCHHYYQKDWSGTHDRYDQFTKSSIFITETTSEADRLNGLEWKGQVNVGFGGASRYSQNGAAWTEWIQAGDPKPSLDGVVIVQKKKGEQWEVVLSPSSYSKPVSCSDVPQ